jgi:hypothetical protein
MYPNHGMVFVADRTSNYHTTTQLGVVVFVFWCLVANPTLVLQWQAGRTFIGFLVGFAHM